MAGAQERNGEKSGRVAARSVPSGNRLIDLAGAALTRTRNAALARIFNTWIYGQTLRGPMPDHMVLYPPELRPGRASAADALFQGRWYLPGGQARAPGGSSPFAIEPPSERWAEELHGFSWLRHFTTADAANSGDTARLYARKLVADWIETEGNWHDIAWRPQVIGRRLMSWVANGALIIDGTDLVYRSMLLRNMARQARHLARVAAIAPAGEPRITAALGLVFSGLCLSEGHKRLKKGIVLLCRELDRQILADGGHVSRNPSAQLSILLDLLSLRDALTARRIEVPKPVRDAVDRMTPMLRFFRHGDGRLALFNGSTEGPEGAIDAAFARDDAKGKPFGLAPHSGYQRLAAGPANIVVDTGAPPPGPFSHEAHAGCLALEMSVGRARLIVNCGATKVLGPEWESASRATAAHSTLVLDDTSSARMLKGRISRALLGARIMEGPVRVESHRNENEAGIWLDAAHDGYAGLFGLVHRRRLFLAASGEDMRGEDVLEAAPTPRRAKIWQRRYWHKPKEDPGFTIRFHIHPDARLSLAHDKTNVLVLLPNGDGWQFRARAGGGECEIAIEESVYLGSGDTTRRAEQIVVAGRVFRGEARVNWAWRRLSTRNAGKREEAEVPELELPQAE